MCHICQDEFIDKKKGLTVHKIKKNYGYQIKRRPHVPPMSKAVFKGMQVRHSYDEAFKSIIV